MRTLDLRQAGNFTWEDLNANHEGSITRRERTKLKWRLVISFVGCLVSLAILWFVLIVSTSNWHDLSRSLVFIPYIVIFIVVIVSHVYQMKTITDDLKSGHVDYVEGQLNHSLSLSRSTWLRYWSVLFVRGDRYACTFKVEDVIFFAPKKVYHLLFFGKRYRVYYAPRSKIFLAMQRIREDINTSQ